MINVDVATNRIRMAPNKLNDTVTSPFCCLPVALGASMPEWARTALMEVGVEAEGNLAVESGSS